MSNMAKNHLERSYAWHDGLLFFKGRVVVPSLSTLQEKQLHKVYDTSIGGHSSGCKNSSIVQECIKQRKNILEDVRYVKE